MKPTEDEFYTDYILNQYPAQYMADKYGVTKRCIYKWAKEYELSRRQPMDEKELMEMLELYEQGGVTQQILADVHDVALNTIKRRLKKAREMVEEKKRVIGINDKVLVVKCELGGHQVGTTGVIVGMTYYDYQVEDDDGVSRFHARYELEKIEEGATV